MTTHTSKKTANSQHKDQQDDAGELKLKASGNIIDDARAGANAGLDSREDFLKRPMNLEELSVMKGVVGAEFFQFLGGEATVAELMNNGSGGGSKAFVKEVLRLSSVLDPKASITPDVAKHLEFDMNRALSIIDNFTVSLGKKSSAA